MIPSKPVTTPATTDATVRLPSHQCLKVWRGRRVGGYVKCRTERLCLKLGIEGSSLFLSPVTMALCRFSSRPAFRSITGDTVRRSTVPRAMERLRQNFNYAGIRVYLDFLTVPLPRRDAGSSVGCVSRAAATRHCRI